MDHRRQLFIFCLSLILAIAIGNIRSVYVYANIPNTGLLQTSYPPPPTPQITIQVENLSFKNYIPVIETPVSLPVKTFSYYINGLYPVGGQESVLYYMGCERGEEDLSLPGTQNTLVFLDFGQAKYNTV